MTPRKRLPAAQRRALILDRAAEVFAERGYSGTSVNEVARRSGVSIPVLYDHFPSKLALFRSVLDDEYARLRDVWGDDDGAGIPVEKRLAAALDAWFAHIERRPNVALVLLRAPAGDDEAQRVQDAAIRDSRSALLPLVVRLFEESAPGSDPLDAEILVELVTASLRALALWWHDRPEVPRAKLVSSMMDTLGAGIGRRLDRSSGQVPPQPGE
ncbi:TetR/AcrR family transcriptional regulator [Actinoplanes sp. NPDC049265]|uniref:TetR/AcrR family transcriptional regulator n=1 Tax=Actinoplanes sp. NPDC049265 TaxID=3363902 RepID=UPI00371D296F